MFFVLRHDTKIGGLALGAVCISVDIPTCLHLRVFDALVAGVELWGDVTCMYIYTFYWELSYRGDGSCIFCTQAMGGIYIYIYGDVL